jgi:transposase-like protein
VILLCVRWYLRYAVAYQHLAELLAERGVAVDPSRICSISTKSGTDLPGRGRHELLDLDAAARM